MLLTGTHSHADTYAQSSDLIIYKKMQPLVQCSKRKGPGNDKRSMKKLKKKALVSLFTFSPKWHCPAKDSLISCSKVQKWMYKRTWELLGNPGTVNWAIWSDWSLLATCNIYSPSKHYMVKCATFPKWVHKKNQNKTYKGLTTNTDVLILTIDEPAGCSTVLLLLNVKTNMLP